MPMTRKLKSAGGRFRNMAAQPNETRQNDTRAQWLATLAKYRKDFDGPANSRCWSLALETCSRDNRKK